MHFGELFCRYVETWRMPKYGRPKWQEKLGVLGLLSALFFACFSRVPLQIAIMT
jgi:hypothetical protein